MVLKDWVGSVVLVRSAGSAGSVESVNGILRVDSVQGSVVSVVRWGW